MTTPEEESAHHEAKERTGEDPPTERAKEQVKGEGEVGAKGLERRDQEP